MPRARRPGPYDLIPTEPDSALPLVERVRDWYARALPGLVRTGAIAGAVGCLGLGVLAVTQCGDTQEVIGFAEALGTNVVASWLLELAGTGRKATLAESNAVVSRASEAERKALEAHLQVLEQTVRTQPDLLHELALSAQEMTELLRLLGESAKDLQTQLEQIATRDELRAIVREELARWAVRPEDPIYVNLPGRNQHFYGRTADEKWVVKHLLAKPGAKVAVSGPSGMGKSALLAAVVYNEKIRDYFADGILWAGFGKAPDTALLQQQWAEELGLDLTKVSDPFARIQAISNRIGQRRVLVVLDDVWYIDHAALMSLTGPNVAHLLSTWHGPVAAGFARRAEHRQLQPLASVDAALRILRALAPAAVKADEGEARTLATAAGGHPMTLTAIGGFLAPLRPTFGDKMRAGFAAMDDPAARLAAAVKRIGQSGSLALDDAFALNLSDMSDATRAAYYALGAFAARPDRFSLDAACAVGKCDEDTIKLFADRNLIEEDTAYPLAPFAMHQAFAAFARAHMPPEATQRHRAHYRTLFASLNVDDSDARAQLEAAWPQVDQAWRATPEQEEELTNLYAAVVPKLEHLWLLPQQEQWAQHLASWANAAKRNHWSATAEVDLGYVAYMREKFDPAYSHYAAARRFYAEDCDQEGMADSELGLGDAAGAQGIYDAAHCHYSVALRLYTEQRGRLGMANAESALGDVARLLDEHDAAYGHYFTALRLFTELVDRQGIANAEFGLGNLASARRKYRVAHGHYTEALKLYTALGARLGMANTHAGLAHLKRARWNRKQACQHANTAAALYREMGIPVNRDIQKIIDDLHCPP